MVVMSTVKYGAYDGHDELMKKMCVADARCPVVVMSRLL